MTTVQMMQKAYESGERDDATVSAYLDAIREQHGCSLIVAVLEVARVDAECVSRFHLQAAVEYMQPESGWMEHLIDALVAESQCPARVMPTVEVIAGDGWPEYEERADVIDGSRIAHHTIVVGAEWIINEIREQKASDHIGDDDEYPAHRP